MKKAEVQAIDNDRQQGQQKQERQRDERVVGDTAVQRSSGSRQP
jgi:hypothetical protein